MDGHEKNLKFFRKDPKVSKNRAVDGYRRCLEVFWLRARNDSPGNFRVFEEKSFKKVLI
jgi:hypothetical protein